MAGIIQFNTPTKNDLLEELKLQYANGVIRGFSGVQAPVTTTDPGVPALIEFTKNGDLFVPGAPGNGINLGVVSNGSVMKDAFDYEGLGLVAGLITWFRHYNNDLTKWIQASVNTSGAVMTVTTTQITVGGPVAITLLRYYA